MWEIWTGGEFPYGRMRNPEVVDFVCNRNGVLSQPEHCPQPIYDIMKDCWKKVSNQNSKELKCVLIFFPIAFKFLRIKNFCY